MRAADLAGRTLTLRLRFRDYTRATRSHTLYEASAASEPILAAGRALLAAAMPTIEQRGITLVGLSVSNLVDGRAIQLAFSFDDPGSHELDAAVDAVRDRFGPSAVTRATLLGDDPGLAAWLPPGDGAGR
jgi:DNA polymerase-4